ncbi:hypothetical protein TNCV_440401 [Trichonephila clavipes]|nr:hypothetical protein TNCV_440401 [Trichonephila clavipes]
MSSGNSLPQFNLGVQGGIQGVFIWCSRLRPTTGVHLAPCRDEFCGPGSDPVEIRRHKRQQQHTFIKYSRLDNAFRFVEWAQNEIAVVPDFHKRILFSDEAHFWLNGYVNKQNCRIWSEANPQVYVKTPLHPEKLTVCCALWAGGILLQKR